MVVLFARALLIAQREQVEAEEGQEGESNRAIPVFAREVVLLSDGHLT